MPKPELKDIFKSGNEFKFKNVDWSKMKTKTNPSRLRKIYLRLFGMGTLWDKMFYSYTHNGIWGPGHRSYRHLKTGNVALAISILCLILIIILIIIILIK